MHITCYTFLKHLLSFTCCVVLLTQCTKEDSPDPNGKYYVQFKVDNKLVSITDTVIANEVKARTTYATVHSIVVGGYKWKESVQDWDPSFVINTAFTHVPIETKTYFAASYDDDANEQFYLTYREDCSSCATYGADHFMETNKNTTITFTEITDEYVKGTFSGTLLLNDPEGHPSKKPQIEISEGKFFAPISPSSRFRH